MRTALGVLALAVAILAAAHAVTSRQPPPGRPQPAGLPVVLAPEGAPMAAAPEQPSQPTAPGTAGHILPAPRPALIAAQRFLAAMARNAGTGVEAPLQPAQIRALVGGTAGRRAAAMVASWRRRTRERGLVIVLEHRHGRWRVKTAGR